MDLVNKNRSTEIVSIKLVKPNQNTKLKFHVPNNLCKFRAETLLTKEPETIAWIDKYGSDGAFYDIGANVGLFSMYFAATKPGTIYAFEPSVFNMAILCKNINLNNFSERIIPIFNPLSNENGIAKFSLSNTDEGGALSAFGVDYGHTGEKLLSTFSYKTMGFSLDFLIENQIVKDTPEIVKIDVDGIEHLILGGMTSSLEKRQCKSVLIEISNKFSKQKNEIERILSQCKFKISECNNGLNKVYTQADTYNQIWVKNDPIYINL